ncbi:diguanylate cyclase [Enterobacter hormaechei]|nr:diguanylate cyclase [Enterobacter hormaechei]
MSEHLFRTNRLHSLYQALARHASSPQAAFITLLEEGLTAFNMTLGIISQIVDNRYTLHAVSPSLEGMSPGMTFDIQGTYCQLVVEKGHIISVLNAGKHADFKTHPIYRQMRLESYISAPLWVRGKIWGTINFSSKEIRTEDFTDEDRDFIGLMAKEIGSLLEVRILTEEKENIISDLRRNNDILEKIFDNSGIGMALVAPTGQWERVNSSLVRMLGYSEPYLLSIDFQKITHPEDLTTDLQFLQALSAGDIPGYQLEKRYQTASGKYIWILLSVSLVREDNGDVKYYIAQIQDMDERKAMEHALRTQREELRQANRALQKMASEDSLTEIANRRMFMAWFESQISAHRRHPRPLSLAIADIDFFKSYNDRYGHPEGDTALRTIAQALTGRLRQKDKIARFGGEEFIFLFPDTDEAQCHQVCESLRQHIEQITSLRRPVTISIGGVTVLPQVERMLDFDMLFKIADAELYEAKHTGRNQVRVKITQNDDRPDNE